MKNLNLNMTSDNLGQLSDAEIARPYAQGFADSRHSGTRWGPVHLFDFNNGDGKAPVCGRMVKRWNFEGDTESDFCRKCIALIRAARASTTDGRA